MFFFKKKFFLTFIHSWDRERQSMNGGGSEREGDTECEAGSRVGAVSTEPDAGLELTNRWDHDLSQSRTLNWLNHSGTPDLLISVAFSHLNQRCDLWSLSVNSESRFSNLTLCVITANAILSEMRLPLPGVSAGVFIYYQTPDSVYLLPSVPSSEWANPHFSLFTTSALLTFQAK